MPITNDLVKHPSSQPPSRSRGDGAERVHKADQLSFPHCGVIMRELPVRLVAVWDQRVAALINRLHRAFERAQLGRESHAPSQNRMPAQQNYFVTFDLKMRKCTWKFDGRNAIYGKAAGV